jgi:TRAP-type transport system periplasmic protein
MIKPGSWTRRGALAAGVASVLPGCAPAPAEPGVLVGQAVSMTPVKSPWDQQWIHFRKSLAKDPSIQISYFNRGETGVEEQQMFDLRRGRASIAGPSLQGLSSIVPELTIAMAPYVMESAAEVDYIYDRYLFEVFQPLFRAKNLRLMQWVEVGWTNLYSNGAVLTPADARGRKLRGSPNRAAQKFLRAVGADSVPLGSTELVAALQTGLIDGGLGASVFHYFSTRDYATDFTLTEHSYDTGGIVANADWWDSATPSQQKTLSTAWMSSQEARASVRGLTQFALGDMAKRGIKIHTLTPAQKKLWRDATGGIVFQLIKEIGGRSQDVYDAIATGRKAFAAGKGA